MVFWFITTCKFNQQRFDISLYYTKVTKFLSYDLIFGSVGCENSKYTCMMHVQGKVQSPEQKHSSLLLFSCRTSVQTCKLKDVDAFIEQFNNLFYTTLRECLRILGENVVISVIFC